MKRIVICPSFASAHFLKCWIPNVIDVIDPDVIIINEGLMPQGPENKTRIDNDFRKRWCYNKHNYTFNVGFDWDILGMYIDPYINSGKQLYVQPIEFKSKDANECFLESITKFGPQHNFPVVGDIIFPLEPDAFHHEVDKQKIHDRVSQLKPGEGISTKWVDFLETQYYTEGINLVQPKYRRFAYCYDNMENYKAAMSGFMSQNYARLQKVDDFITYHYCWFQPEPYKTLRFELIHRPDGYWNDFQNGLNMIRWETELHSSQSTWGTSRERENYPPTKIVIRPSRSDEGRYAKFIDVSHPKHIQEHPNFVK